MSCDYFKCDFELLVGVLLNTVGAHRALGALGVLVNHLAA